MLKRLQVVMVLVTLAAGLLLANMYPSYRLEKPEFKELKARSGPLAPTAFILSNALTEGLNVSALTPSYLFLEGEKALVWLGQYKLFQTRAYSSSGYMITVLMLERGGQDETLLFDKLREGMEVYAFIPEGDGYQVVPLLRVVSNRSLIEIYGKALGVDSVLVYAYAYPEDFNASKPDPNLLVGESRVVNGRYLLRLERGSGPLTPRGRPLLEVNSTLVVYARCAYHFIDLLNVSDWRIPLDFNCSG